MSSYDCYGQHGAYRVGGFPDDVIGLDEWRRLFEQLDQFQEPGLDQSYQDPLSALRALHHPFTKGGTNSGDIRVREYSFPTGNAIKMKLYALRGLQMQRSLITGSTFSILR
jgi:hypothetical protein